MRGHVLPIGQVILLPVSCTVTYLWSVLLGHVEPGFPYISDTGTYPPESCLFGLLLNLYAITSAMIAYLRWQQVKTFYQADLSRALRRANNVSLVLGLVASFGVLLVANFQVTNVIVVHLIGALLAFVMGAAYAWVQTYISYGACLLPGHRKCLHHFRLGLSASISVCCALALVFALLSGNKHGNIDNSEHSKWSPSDKGFTEHVVSTAMEWATAFLSAIFFATFTQEFRHFTVAMPIEFTFVCTEVKDNAVANGNGKCEEESYTSRELETSSATFTISSGTVNE